MAQMQLDMSRLTQITGEDLDGKKERRAILDYLYQLTEQLRYWQNNIEQENMTHAFAQDYDGMKKSMAEIRVENDSIRLLVKETEGQFAEILLTADGAKIQAQNAADKVASLTVEVDKIESMVGSLNGPANYVQYEEPEAPEAGDIWVDTGHQTWAMLATGTWSDADDYAWGHWYNRLYKTRVYDGAGWVLLSDEAKILKQETRITQTEESITHMAMRQEAVEGVVENHETLIRQNAEEISLKASSTEMGSLREEVAGIEITSQEIVLKVQELENKKPSNLDNGIVVIDQEGVHMHGGTLDLDANSAVKVESGGSVNIQAGAELTIDADNFTLTADGTLTARNATLENATINGIAAGEIDADKVTVKNLNADNITAGKLNGKYISELGADNLQDGAVETDKLADEAITGDKIKARSIEADHIKANSITVNELASDIGENLDLSSNVSIDLTVRNATSELPKTYVQYEEPDAGKRGDVWYNTGDAQWATAKSKTWQQLQGTAWGALYNRAYGTYVYNGSAWVLVEDRQVIIDQETRIRQTEESLKLTATKAELSGKVNRTEYEQNAEAINMRVQTVENNSGKAHTVTNAAVTLDQAGIMMQGGKVEIGAESALDVQSGGTVNIAAASEKSQITLGPAFTANGAGVTADSGNFKELTAGNYPVLTTDFLGYRVMVSKERPENVHGVIWIAPSAVTSVEYRGYTSDARDEKVQLRNGIPISFELEAKSGDVLEGSGTYDYKLRLQLYLVGDNSRESDVRLNVSLQKTTDSGKVVAFNERVIPTMKGWTAYNVELAESSTVNLSANADPIAVTIRADNVSTPNLFVQSQTYLDLTVAAQNAAADVQLCSVHFIS